MVKTLADRYLNLVDPFYHFISERATIVTASNNLIPFGGKRAGMGMGQCWPQIIIMKLVLKYVQAFSKKANKGKPEISPAALA